MAQTTLSFGASIRGPLHLQQGITNQDAWLRAEGSFGSLIVVCDGLGSRPDALLGSRSACLAVREACVRWTRVTGAPVYYLVHLIEVLWRLRIYPCAPPDAATTCLLALALPTGEMVVGGIGDGLVAIRTGDLPVSTIIGDRADSFSNETCALGVSPGMKAWHLTKLPFSHQQRLAVLASDGVADDLNPEKLDDFCDWLIFSFEELHPVQRWHRLVAELRAWPTPRHLDDKTIAVLKVNAEVAGRKR